MILLYLVLRDMLKLTFYVLDVLVRLFLWVCGVIWSGIELAIEAHNNRKDANNGTHEEGGTEEDAPKQARYSDRR